MQIPKYIEVKTASGQRAAFLSPKDDENSIKDCFIERHLNGESTLEFSIPATSEKINELTPECQIHASGRVFTLLTENASDIIRDENNKLWAKFVALERWAELDLQMPEPYITNDPNIPVPADLAVIIVSGGSNLSDGIYPTGTAAHALYAVLKGSGWSVGIVDVPGIHDLESEKASRLQLIKQIVDIWGGYVLFDSLNKIVHLRDNDLWQNYTGFQIRYKKNLKHITRTQNNRLVTKLYPFGHDDLDIASVNGGLKYLTNFSYTPREYIGIYKNQDIYDAQELKERAISELAIMSRPRYLYKAKMVDIRTLPEYSHENFDLGDMADVIDESVAPDSPRMRIIRYRYNVFRPWECEVDIGDPQKRLEENLKASFDNTGFIDSKFNWSGKMSGQSIEKYTVTGAQIANLSIVNSHIANLTITGSKIANATIEDAKIVSLSAEKIISENFTAINNIYIGDQTNGTGKGIYFFNNGIDEHYIVMAGGLIGMAINTTRGLSLGVGDAYDITSLSGGLSFSFTRPFSIYSSSSSESSIGAGNGGLRIFTNGSGDIYIRPNGSGSVRIGSSVTDVILSQYSYISSVSATNLIATQGWVSGSFSPLVHSHSQYCTVQLYGGYLEFYQNGVYIGRCLASG